MIIFDAHCDTIQKINDFGGELYENNFHIDLKRIKSLTAGYVQTFAAFIDKRHDMLPPFLRCNQLIDCYYECIKKECSLVAHCNNFSEIQESLAQNRVAALLSIEGGEALEGDLQKLYFFYNRGVRIMTLTWNYSNEICDGIQEESGRGLTDFGKRVVNAMNQAGMLIDVSHISLNGFWDVIEITDRPIVATHSNTKAICPHKRNLGDSQIKAIINNGGCIGVNLYAEFLSNGKCSVKSVIKHIEHILSLGGENNVGLGCDFDGVDKLPQGMNGVSDIYKIFNEMIKIGYSDSLINKISSGNFLNIIKKL